MACDHNCGPIYSRSYCVGCGDQEASCRDCGTWLCKCGPAVPDESTVAAEAHNHVYGSRAHDYGHPRDDFARTAQLWTALLAHKLQPDATISAEDIARCMIAVKLSRDVHSPKRDNRVDIAGYAVTLDRLETGA